MSNSFVDIVDFLRQCNEVISILLVLITIVLYYHHRYYLWVMLYCVSMGLMEFSSRVYSSVYGNNLFFFHFNAFAEFIITTFYFYYLYAKLGLKLRYFKPIMISGLVVLSISVLVNSYAFSMTFASLVILLFCYYYYYLMLRRERFVRFDVDLIFVTSLLIMHSISIIVLLFREHLMTMDMQYFATIEGLRILGIVLANAMVLWISGRKIKEMNQPKNKLNHV